MNHKLSLTAYRLIFEYFSVYKILFRNIHPASFIIFTKIRRIDICFHEKPDEQEANIVEENNYYFRISFSFILII